MLIAISLAAASSLVPQFGEKVSITGGVPGTSTAVPFDLDGDGDLDLVVGSQSEQAVYWLEQVSPGTPIGFAPPRIVVSDLGAPPLGIRFADLDADGTQDILVAGDGLYGDQGQIVWVRGLGSGSFDSPVRIDDGTGPAPVTLADIDGDGDQDLVLSRKIPVSGQVFRAAWIENLGGGVFAQTVPLPGVPVFALDLAAADFDGDGDIDLAGSLPGGSHRLYRNEGGAFLSVPLAGTGEFRRVLAEDLDGDGDADLVFSEGITTSSVLTYDNVAGTLTVGGSSIQSMREVRSVDADLDGDLDLVGLATTGGSREVLILYLDGPSTIADQERIESQTILGSRTLGVGDLNGDGFTDLAIATIDNSVAYLTADPAGQSGVFKPSFELALTPIRRIFRSMTADVDGDGDEDVIIGRDRRIPYLSKNLGSSLLLVPEPIQLDLAAQYTQMEVLDMDGDSIPDGFGILRNNGYAWTRGLGDGTFGDPIVVRSGSFDIFDPYFLADADGDGDLDLATPGTSTGWTLAIQTAPGQFLAATSLPRPGVNQLTQFGALGDLTGDGFIDFVQVVESTLLNNRERHLLVHEGTGSSQFQAAPFEIARIEDRLRVSSIWLGDLDQDSDLDVAWFDQEYRDMAVAENLGTGRIGIINEYSDLNASLMNELLVGDVDLDGLPDLLTRASTGLTLWRNMGGLSFAMSTAVTGSFDHYSLGDLDADGDLDVIATEPADSDVAWFPGTTIEPVGEDVCGAAVPGSSGLAAELIALGSVDVLSNDLRLRASRLPATAATLFLASLDTALVPAAGGGIGTLCLGGQVGRFVQGVQSANADGTVRLDVDLSAIPQPTGARPAIAGEIWHFQAWFRDTAQGMPTSNFSSAAAVTLR